MANTVPFDFEVRPALCLDLDGTVRLSKQGKDKFISGPDDIVLMPGIEPIIWQYRDAGYIVVAVTNQGGVAHGHKTEKGVHQEWEATKALFDKSPFHIFCVSYAMADGKLMPYSKRSLFRKPDIGMLCAAEVTAYNSGHVLDWDNSLFVGDRPEDEQCAANARVPFLHIDAFLSAPTHPITPATNENGKSE